MRRPRSHQSVRYWRSLRPRLACSRHTRNEAASAERALNRPDQSSCARLPASDGRASGAVRADRGVARAFYRARGLTGCRARRSNASTTRRTYAPSNAWSARHGSTGTPSPARRRGRQRHSPSAARSRRSNAEASRSSAHPGITRCATARWASASSTTPWSMARHAVASGLAARVAIVDWDVHHGNGTEELALDDPVLAYASLHQWPLYPGTGGPGTSSGNVLNVPLAAGSDDAAYRAAFRAEVEPFVARFEPDLVVVSAGFDAYRLDPLAGMELTAAGFHALAAGCARLAPGWRASSREATSPKRCQTWSRRRSRGSTRAAKALRQMTRSRAGGRRRRTTFGVLRLADPRLRGKQSDRETAGDAAPAVSFRFHPRKPLGLRPLSIRPGRPVRHRPRWANRLAQSG